MTKIEIFDKMMEIANKNGYSSSDYRHRHGFITEGQNISSLMFDSTFNNTLFKDAAERVLFLHRLSLADDKWKFIESNLNSFHVFN